MSEWKNLDIIPSLLGLEGILSGMQYTAEFAQNALTPIQEILNLLVDYIPTTQPDSFSIDTYLTQFFLTAEVVHLYAQQPYQLMPFVLWRSALYRSFELGATDLRWEYQPKQYKDVFGEQTNCLGSAPYRILVLAVANADAQAVIDQSQGLMDLFGEARAGIKDIPGTLDRALARATPSYCATMTKILPVLGFGFELTDGFLTINLPSGPINLLTAIRRKLDRLNQRIQAIQDFLTLFRSLKVPNVRVFEGEIASLAAIPSVLGSAANAPGDGDYVVGSAIIAGGAVISTLSRILSIAE